MPESAHYVHSPKIYPNSPHACLSGENNEAPHWAIGTATQIHMHQIRFVQNACGGYQRVDGITLPDG